MIKGITTGVIAALTAQFEECTVYTGQVEQGLALPCFFVLCIAPSQERVRGERYRADHLFCIQYMEEDGNNNEAYYDVLEQLYETLEYITADGDLIRGTDMRGEIADGVLHFYVSYNVFLRAVSEHDLMDGLEPTYHLKTDQ